jgi:ribosome-associated protein
MSDVAEEMGELADGEQQRVSKSQLKRESAALQDLAAELAELPKAQLASLPLTEDVFAAICQAASLPHRGARKRQLKYVGGLFREIDVQPIVERLARIKNQSAVAAREHHKVEHWRERLVLGGDADLTALLHGYPDADRQHLRQLIRSAKKEAAESVPPRSSRQLFRYLRELFENADNG